MTLYPVQDSLVRGEISPRLHSRASLDLYRSGLASCVNFVTLPHGGIRKRGGSQFVGAVKHEDRDTRGIPFKFSNDQAYWLEFGHLYIRIYAYGGYVTEISAPWSESHLRRIQTAQSADVMWIVHPSVPPYKLTRLANASWSLALVDFTDGPFTVSNVNESATAYVSASTGAVTINASGGIFSPSDVGRLFRIEIESYGAIDPWSPGGTFANENEEINGKLTRYDGNVYRAASSGISLGSGGWRYGATPPTHLKGIERDGPTVSVQDTYQEGVAWEYLHSGFGVAKITAYTSPTQVSATVLSRFPSDTVGSGNAQYIWSFGAFGAGVNPVAVALFEERLFYASKLSVYGSKTGDFSSFRIGEKDDDALEFLLAANEANEITWLTDVNGFLGIGTIGGVRALSGSGIDEALTPSSFKNRSSATSRCSYQTPLNAGQAFVYVNGGGRSASEMVAGQNGRFESADIFQVSEHLPKQGGGIISSGYQEYPDPIAWFTFASGELCGFTYQRDQEVRGFHRHRLGGSDGGLGYGRVSDVAVTPGQTGSDDVWLIIKRTINGQQRQYIEILRQPFEYAAKADAFCLDSALTYAGAPANTVSGLDHLEGQPVEALADGVEYDGLIVSGGAITLPAGITASKITVGLSYQCEGETLELDAGGRDGSRMGRRKRVNEVYFSVMETDVSRLEVSSKVKARWETAKLNTHAPTDDLFTGTLPPVTIDDSWQGNAKVRLRHSGPKPCTIRAIIPAFDSEP